MSRGRELPDAIQWHEGMLLEPQHLQQLARRHEELVHYHAAAIAPFHWGVEALAVDDVALKVGMFRIDELEAVLPDGLVVSHRPGIDGALSLDLKPLAEAMRRRPMPIWLAVPARRRDGSTLHGELARYASIEGETVTDETTGEGELRIPRLRPRPRLLASYEPPPAKYAALPLARVAHGGKGFELSTAYEPPRLAVAEGSPLHEVGVAVKRRLREKALVLTGRARSRTIASRTPQLLETKQMLRSVVAALPQLEALLETGVAHPFALYLALCQVVGQIAGLGRSQLPDPLPPYDHGDPLAALGAARDVVFRVLGEGILESYTGVRFDQDGNVFSIHFDESWRERPLILGASAPTGVSERELVAWMAQALIGSQGLVQTMRERVVLGAPRSVVEGDADLVPTDGVVLFGLEADRDWIEPNELLQVVEGRERDAAARPIEIVMYVKNREPR